MNFVHLHIHSHYSLLDGLAKIDDLVEKAKDLNMKALALTDHGTMYGIIEFYQKCKKAGIKPIIGVEVYVTRHEYTSKRPKIDERPFHLILLAKDDVGYKNLIKLTTIAHLEGFYYKPRIDFELLKKHHEGLIACSACLQGEIPAAILNGDEKNIEETVLKYKNLFGSDFYLELQYHPSIEKQGLVNKKIAELGNKFDIPLIATNDVHYLNTEDAEAQDVLLCLQTKKKKEDKDRMCMLGEDFSFWPAEVIAEGLKDHPEALENTVKIAEQCNLEIELGKTQLPYFKVPEGKTADEYLKELCYKGLEKRFELSLKDVEEKADDIRVKEIIDRLEFELSVIEKTGFAPYFLIVQDFVNWAKGQDIVVGPGRGSAAGSIVSYLTNITNIDPLKYELLFERFLNPERVSMPDIDLDFADTRRDEVIRYVEEKYGHDRVAQIITFGTMAARAAIRDVGRVLDIPYTYCDKVAKMIPMFSSLDKALNVVPELKDLYDKDLDAKRLIDTAKKLEGVARHASTHACGVVITREPLEHYLPVQYASSGDKTIVSQYSLHPIEDLGLLKMDFLGLKNLTVLEQAIEVIEKTRGVKIDIDEIPLDDKKTFKLLRKAETTGVFQLESSGMRRYLKQLKPTDFEDIIAMVALYRPGPIEWIPDFINRKHGKKEIIYIHPTLKKSLDKTYGIAVYQEQVMQISRDLAGFTLAEADVLRKAVGKKIPKLLAEQKDKFIRGCINNSISGRTAEQVFAFIEPFAGYGFNRSHAACYAMIAYHTAYLKANYPEEFMASLLTSDQGDLDRVAIEVRECNRLGIEVLPPDINESYSTFTVVASTLGTKTPRIRFGLNAVKNLGENIVKNIIRERKQDGSYKDLEDLLSRVKSKDLNKKSLESLVKSGALDKFGERMEMLNNIERLLSFIKDNQRDRDNGQSNLFSGAGLQAKPVLRLEPTDLATDKQKLTWEKEFLGLYISKHPMEEFETQLSGLVVPLSDLDKYPNKKSILVAGIISSIKRVITRKGEAMLFAKIEDASGWTEILVFPSSLRDNYDIWQEDKIILVNGRLSDKDGEKKLICSTVKEISQDNVSGITDELSENIYTSNGNGYLENSSRVLIDFSVPLTQDLTTKLKSLFSEFPGENKVYLIINNKRIETNTSIEYNESIKEEIESLVGFGSVKFTS